MSETPASEVIGRIPSGCAVLTAVHGERATGLLASWVQQASMTPVLVSVAVRTGRPILELLEGSRRAVLNVLPETPQALFKHFGRGFALDEDAFAGLNTERCDHGVILRDALGFAACELEGGHVAGDHQLLLLRPVGGRLLSDASPHVHIRQTATGY